MAKESYFGREDVCLGLVREGKENQVYTEFTRQEAWLSFELVGCRACSDPSTWEGWSAGILSMCEWIYLIGIWGPDQLLGLRSQPIDDVHHR